MACCDQMTPGADETGGVMISPLPAAPHTTGSATPALQGIAPMWSTAKGRSVGVDEGGYLRCVDPGGNYGGHAFIG